MINATVKQNIQDRIEARAAKKRLLTPKEAAAFLRVHPGTMSNWRYKGVGPSYVKIGGKVFYFQADLENSTASASLVGRLDIPDLMASDWSFFDTTPAGGVAYYNEKEDRTAIKYPNSIKLYYHRVPGTHDKWAINFMNCKVFEV